MRLTQTIASIAAATLLAATGAAHAAAAIDVQFSNGAGHAQTGAAAAGSTGDAWNTFTTGNTGSGALVDTTNAASGVSLSFSANTFWESDPGFDKFTGSSAANLMQGYLVGYVGDPDVSLAFTGLAAGQEYGFWVYTQGDNNSNGRSISLSANGGATQVATQTNAANLTLDNNYVYLTTFADANGVVDIDGHALNGEANINGVQLMAVPEPSSIALLLAGFAFIVGATVRKSRAR